MKSLIITAGLLVVLVILFCCTESCQKSTASNPQPKAAQPEYSIFIPIEEANKMIQSYLNGINYRVNTKETRSFAVSADSLRAYLNNNKIKTMKLFLAHSKEWMDAGNTNKRPGPNENGLTIVIVGVDAQNRYVFFGNNLVLDRAGACPDYCIGYEMVE